MADSTSHQGIETQLAHHGIPVDALPRFFQLATLDRSRSDWRTTLDDQICMCIQLLGSVREPDLIKGRDQPTINCRTRELSNAGTIRVVRYAPAMRGAAPAALLVLLGCVGVTLTRRGLRWIPGSNDRAADGSLDAHPVRRRGESHAPSQARSPRFTIYRCIQYYLYSYKQHILFVCVLNYNNETSFIVSIVAAYVPHA